MNGVKPNEFPNISNPLTGTEEVYTQTGGVNTKFTLNDIKSFLGLNYKSYVALLTQTGTDAPFVDILYNDIGNIAFTYSSAGTYIGTLNNAFPVEKTFLMMNQTFDGLTLCILSLTSSNTVKVETFYDGSKTNDILSTTAIEIRVYE